MHNKLFAIGLIVFSCLLPASRTLAQSVSSEAQTTNSQALFNQFQPELDTSQKVSSGQKIDNIYVFGDSLSDDGNIYHATGNTVPPSPPYYQGKFTNGQVWVETLARELGLMPNPKTNFAYGGASTGYYNPVMPATSPLYLTGILSQITNFTSTNLKVDPDSLYVVWGGANDYLYGGVTDTSGPVNNIAVAVKALADVGAKEIMVLNLPDLGQVPGANNTSAGNQLSNLSTQHNLNLQAKIKELRQELKAEGVDIFLVDVNLLLKLIDAYPSLFGFKDVTDACLPDSESFIHLNLKSSFPTVNCANPNQFLFWDEIHPTSAGHYLIADLAFWYVTHH